MMQVQTTLMQNILNIFWYTNILKDTKDKNDNIRWMIIFYIHCLNFAKWN